MTTTLYSFIFSQKFLINSLTSGFCSTFKTDTLTYGFNLDNFSKLASSLFLLKTSDSDI